MFTIAFLNCEGSSNLVHMPCKSSNKLMRVNLEQCISRFDCTDAHADLTIFVSFQSNGRLGPTGFKNNFFLLMIPEFVKKRNCD